MMRSMETPALMLDRRIDDGRIREPVGLEDDPAVGSGTRFGVDPVHQLVPQ